MRVEFMIAQYNHPIRREQRIQGMASKIAAEMSIGNPACETDVMISRAFEFAETFEAECQKRMKKVQADALS